MFIKMVGFNKEKSYQAYTWYLVTLARIIGPFIAVYQIKTHSYKIFLILNKFDNRLRILVRISSFSASDTDFATLLVIVKFAVLIGQ